MPQLDYNSFGTQEKIALRWHAEKQEAVHQEIANVAVQVISLHAKMDALQTVVRNYHESRLLRALRFLRLVPEVPL